MYLVTGGTGFIGHHLLEKLSLLRTPARALVRRVGAAKTLPAGIELAHGDLVSGTGLEAALDGTDTVIHLAGVTKALRAADYYACNVQATENLLRAIGGRQVRLVHVSSLAAIGPSGPGHPLNEDAAPHPLTHYGRSKLEGEQRVRHTDPRAVIVRPPVVYGPRDTDVFQILKSVAKGLVVEIAGAKRWFSAIYVEDLVEGILAAATARAAAGRDYFLTNPKPASWSELGAIAASIMSRRPRTVKIPAPLAYCVGCAAELSARVTGRPGIVSREKVREARCLAWTCDGSRAAAELGFHAKTPLEEGLRKTLAWYKEAGWLTW
jgi:nucleoside-diphosphate-sugar epimerase